MGQRTRERLLGQDAADRLRLARADPDRQDALAVQLAQDDDVLLALVLEDEPVDTDFEDLHGLLVRLPEDPARVRFVFESATDWMKAGASSVRMWSIIHWAEVASSECG